MRGRELHDHIRRQIERRLGGRSWTWLAEESGVPRTTLASQSKRPKFSVDVLLRVATALDQDVTDLLPEVSPVRDPRARALRALSLLEDAIEELDLDP